jgi:PBSX family phage terminase large subunit
MTITLSPWQSKVIDDTHRFKVINCGRRAGKSFLVAIKLLDFASNNPKSIVWYISPNYKQSKSIMWTMLRDIIPQHGISRTNETELKIELKNGSQILLKGAEDPDSLRGVRIDFCVFDEVAFIDKWNEVWKVVRPTLIDSKASCWFISTPNGFNHFKEMYENVAKDGKPVFAPSDWIAFHYTSYDNPYLDKLELESAKATTDEDSFAQEYMGEFRKMVGLIYKEFDRDIHMVDIPAIDYNYSFTRALDFGFAHKTALIYFAISSSGDAIYGYDGLYQEGLTENQIADVVKVKDSGRTINNPVADSAQPMSIQQLAELGVSFNPVEKAPDSVKSGIVKVAELLKVRADTGKPTLMFNKNLPWIADEFERYRWMENKSADNAIKETPNKVNDDAMDAIRYFAMTYKKDTDNYDNINAGLGKKWSI